MNIEWHPHVNCPVKQYLTHLHMSTSVVGGSCGKQITPLLLNDAFLAKLIIINYDCCFYVALNM